jgi:hypothetical protein
VNLLSYAIYLSAALVAFLLGVSMWTEAAFKFFTEAAAGYPNPGLAAFYSLAMLKAIVIPLAIFYSGRAVADYIEELMIPPEE